MGIGALLSPIFLLIGNTPFYGTIALAGIIGTYFGFGFPVLLGYYSATTNNTNRAKISGLTIFFTYIGFYIINIIIPAAISNTPPLSNTSNTLLPSAISLILWKLIGIITIALLKPTETKISNEETSSYKNILKMHPILFYLLLWLIFSIVNNFALPILHHTFGNNNIITTVSMIETILAGTLAILFGFLADRTGRKRLIFIGFVTLGLGYAVLGLLPTTGGLYFYTIVDGIAWGIFSPLFLLTIWGDLAGKKGSEKFFVIGLLPYLLSNFLEVAFSQYIILSITGLTTIFTFICFFLFIAVIPLYLAPETLSEQEIQEIKLKNYLKKAQTKVEKETKKTQTNNNTTD